MSALSCFGQKIQQIYVLKATYNNFEKIAIPYRQTRFLEDMTVNIDYVVAILTGIEIFDFYIHPKK